MIPKILAKILYIITNNNLINIELFINEQIIILNWYPENDDEDI